jgi:hypothetical protein
MISTCKSSIYSKQDKQKEIHRHTTAKMLNAKDREKSSKAQVENHLQGSGKINR